MVVSIRSGPEHRRLWHIYGPLDSTSAQSLSIVVRAPCPGNAGIQSKAAHQLCGPFCDRRPSPGTALLPGHRTGGLSPENHVHELVGTRTKTIRVRFLGGTARSVKSLDRKSPGHGFAAAWLWRGTIFNGAMGIGFGPDRLALCTR